ncbi:MAG: helix-turn-helix transcriptional regulator [Clostridia bacterium]|nr:helix-turn-helix transcriptional regulator [Clostridia bacterium]
MKQISYQQNKNIIHNRLREARLRCGFSQEQLAAQMQLLSLNIDQQIISRIEKNQRQVTDYEVACLCKCLRVSFEWLIQDHAEFCES